MPRDTHNSVVKQSAETALLVGVNVRGQRPLLSLEDSLSELTLLAETAGMEVVGHVTQHVSRIEPSTMIGSGKVEEVRQEVLNTGAKVVIFDDELSPRHQRELEERFGLEVKLLDRSALILDIFAQHANTREGAQQVELAQYEYRMPRLTRMWTHLARQGGGGAARGGSGGVGLRGPGETQLEVDKREIQRRISKLKADLDKVRDHRQRHRQQRHRSGVPVIAVVGYTNAGKSTLLNALTGADVYVADQLFATLDPTTRRLKLPSNREVVFTDTVGFIQKLPTTLIAAFRATLEEVVDADLLLHVVDMSHPNVVQHIESVEDTLAEMDVPEVPRVLVWNKSDQWGDQPVPYVDIGENYYPQQIAISARKKQGLDVLLQAVEGALAQHLSTIELMLPYNEGELLSLVYRYGTVQHRRDAMDGILLTVLAPPMLVKRLKSYQR
jgi:GTPase